MSFDKISEIVRKQDLIRAEIQSRTADLQAQLAVLDRQLAAEVAVAASKVPTTPVEEPRRKKPSPKQEAAIGHILSRPQANYESLVPAVYGMTDEKANASAHSLIQDMRRKKIIEGKPGAWRVLTPHGGGSALALSSASTGGGRKNGTSPR
jgi:hypothetical protein